jgi:replicative DNA helicase
VIQDKTLPHNIEAEEAVLGSVLIDSERYWEVCTLNAEDFYRDKNVWVWEAIQAVDLRNQVTIAHELANKGRLEAVGGAAYLSHLVGNCGSSVHARYYADIVKLCSDSRKLIRASGNIEAIGYEQKPNMIDLSLSEILSLRADTGGVFTPRQLAEHTIDHYSRLASGELHMTYFGIRSLDLLGGMQPGEYVVVGGETEMGKGLVHGTTVLTPQGWVKVEKLKTGDTVFDEEGMPTKVLGVYPQGERQCYRFIFSDDTFIENDSEHLWKVQTKYSRHCRQTGRGATNSHYQEWRVIPTSEIVKRCGLGEVNIRKRLILPTNKPINFKKEPVPLDPYLLGLLLGDGSFRDSTPKLSTTEEEMLVYIKAIGITIKRIAPNKGDYRLLGISGIIRSLKLNGLYSTNKYIPHQYLFNDIDTRLSILRGLMDTDGYINGNGRAIEFYTSSERLAEDVMFLVRSLGGICNLRTHSAKYTYRGQRREGKLAYRITIRFNDLNPFKLKRKADKYNVALKTCDRVIHRIEDIGSHQTTCLRVDSPTAMFIAKDFIVTHNTTLLKQIANAQKGEVLYATTEMTKDQWAQRVLASAMHIPMSRLGSEAFVKNNIDNIILASGKMDTENITIITGSITPNRIRAEASKIANLKLIIVDYLQRMRGVTANYESVSIASRDLADMAKDTNIPLIVASQLSRENPQAKEKKQLIDRLKDSGNIANDADWIVFISRNKNAKPHTEEYLDAKLNVEKHKQGGEHPEVPMKFDIDSQCYHEKAEKQATPPDQPYSD